MVFTALKQVFAALLLLGPALAFAQAPDMALQRRMKEYEYRQSHYASWVRISGIGGVGMRDLTGGTGGRVESGGDAAGQGFTGALLLELGRGLLTIEGGAQFLQTATPVNAPNEAGEDRRHLLLNQYVGAPILLKLNYFESPQAVFSLKGGIMPIFLMNNGGELMVGEEGPDQRLITLNSTDMLAVAGFTGSAPLSRDLAFLVDGSYYQGFMDVDGLGSRNQGFLFGIGLRYSL